MSLSRHVLSKENRLLLSKKVAIAGLKVITSLPIIPAYVVFLKVRSFRKAESQNIFRPEARK